MLTLAAYALEPRRQVVYVSGDDKWLKAMQTDKNDLLKWLTRAAFVWLDVYLVASAVIGYHSMADFIEFQRWLILVILCFGTVSVIALAVVLCVNMSPDTVSNYDDDEEEEEDAKASRVAVKNEIVEDFADYEEGGEAEEEEEEQPPFLESGSPETATAADDEDGDSSPGLRHRRAWSM
jgi:hypothetical protein